MGALWFSHCCAHLTLTPAPGQQPLLWAANDLQPSLMYSPPLHRHILRFRAQSQVRCRDKLPPGWKHISPWKAQVPQREGPSFSLQGSPSFCPCFRGCQASSPTHQASLPFSPRSLAVGPQYSSLGTQPILCASIPGLVPKQLRFCRNYVEIMPSVAEGVRISIEECQHQFRGRRWNCTTVNNSLAIFGPVLDKGTLPGGGGGVAACWCSRPKPAALLCPRVSPAPPTGGWCCTRLVISASLMWFLPMVTGAEGAPGAQEGHRITPISLTCPP